MKHIVKTSVHQSEYYRGRHRFEHWYVDNQVYFITARCRSRFPAFASEAAKEVFWRQFDKYTAACGFTPWVVSLLDNYYHLLGYNRKGSGLQTMMQRLHGSVAKLVNDVLRDAPAEAASAAVSDSGRGRVQAPAAEAASAGGLFDQVRAVGLRPFFRDERGKEFFDGCLHDTRQGRLKYRYVLTQCRRHGICDRPEDYPHTRVVVECERAICRAVELGAFMEGVPYPRYRNHRGGA